MVRHIILGRFAPLHRGHEKLIRTMIEKYGEENSAVIIGSSNVPPNPRTPFTFRARKNFFLTLFPHLRILQIPDIEADLEIQRSETLWQWQYNLKNMETSSGERWIFCAGNEADVADLTKDFETEILIPRESAGENISGTYIRKLLSEKKIDEVKKYVPRGIYKQIVKNYRES